MKTKKVVKPKSNTTLTAAEAASALAPLGDMFLPPGARVDMGRLREEAARAIRRGIDLGAFLAPGGWAQPQDLGLQAALVSFDRGHSAYGDAKEASRQATLTFEAQVVDSLAFREQVVAALRIATQGTENPFKDDRLHLSTSRKPHKLALWMTEVMPEVRKHSAALQARFGTDPVALVEEQTSKLTTAMATKNASRSLIPAAYKTQQDARLKLAAAIHEQRLAAKVAFPKDKEKLALFVPVWEKKRTAKSATVTPGSGATPAPAAPTGPQTPSVPAEPATPVAPVAPAAPAVAAELPAAAAATAAVKPAEAALARPN